MEREMNGTPVLVLIDGGGKEERIVINKIYGYSAVLRMVVFSSVKLSYQVANLFIILQGSSILGLAFACGK